MKNIIKIAAIALIIAIGFTACDDDDNDPCDLGHDFNGIVSCTEYPATSVEVCTRCSEIGETRAAQIGDTGPGGGIIFYIADGEEERPLGFEVTSTTSAFETYTAHYLEAAPENAVGGTGTQTMMRWSTQDGSPYPNVAGTLITIGSGRNNTALIIAAEKAAHPANTFIYAALACDNYNTDSKDDWFLPSKDELNEFYKQKSYFGLTTGYFWSSSQAAGNFAWDRSFLYGAESYGGAHKNVPTNVRAIRAF
ncbi:MAG: DUF1566 domain-containing protein [Treponema sp.]|nr:DUF1566 domain-containing protein [Treponema sp.]